MFESVTVQQLNSQNQADKLNSIVFISKIQNREINYITRLVTQPTTTRGGSQSAICQRQQMLEGPDGLLRHFTRLNVFDRLKKIHVLVLITLLWQVEGTSVLILHEVLNNIYNGRVYCTKGLSQL